MDGLQMKYFVLKPRGSDPYAYASRAALVAYAEAIRSENSELARDLREWVLQEIKLVAREGKEEVCT